MKKLDWYLLLLLSVLLLVFKFLLFNKVLIDLNTYILPDDSFYSLLIAKNIALGKGFLYGDNFTNGFQPLFVFLMVPVYFFLTPDIITPIYISLIILMVFSFASLYLIYRLMILLFKNSFVAFTSALLFVVTPASLRNSTNGLETIISFFFFLLGFYLLYKYYDVPIKNISAMKYFFFGVILGFALLARIDNIFLFVAIFIFIILKRKEFDFNCLIKYSSIFIIGFLLIYLPYLILSYHYTGTLYPVSGKSVSYQAHFLKYTLHSDKNFILFEVFRVIRICGSNYIINILLCILLFCFFYWKNKFNSFKDINLKKHLPLIITSILFILVYILLISAYWAFDRYFYSMFIPLLILTSYFLFKFYLYIQSFRFKNIILVSIILILFFVNILRPGIKGFLFDNSIDLKGYVNISRYVNDNLPKGTVIGAMQTGAFGYFANNLKVVNLDGVVNKDAYESLASGHLIEYIKKCKIEYLLLWDINYQLLAYSSVNLSDNDITLVKIIDDNKSLGYDWYLYKVNY